MNILKEIKLTERWNKGTVLIPLYLIISLMTSMVFLTVHVLPFIFRIGQWIVLVLQMILVIFSESQKGLQTVLNKLDNYCFKWQLTVNIKKTKTMVFQRNNSPFSEFFYKNQPLTVTHEYNFLGNSIDNKGNF